MQYRSHRYQTQFPITVRSRQGLEKAQVLDVNTTGARLAGVPYLRRGDKLTLDILSYRAEGVVCWTMRDTCGISFRPHISPTLVDTIRQRKDGRGRVSGARGRVGFHFAELR